MLLLRQLSRCACVNPGASPGAPSRDHHQRSWHMHYLRKLHPYTHPQMHIIFASTWMPPLRHVTSTNFLESQVLVGCETGFVAGFVRGSRRITTQDRGRSILIYSKPHVSPHCPQGSSSNTPEPQRHVCVPQPCE